MQSNASKSPLLRLPLEILWMILTELVGNMMIHVNLRRPNDFKRSPLAFNICQATITEEEAVKEFMTRPNNWRASAASQSQFQEDVTRFATRHANCTLKHVHRSVPHPKFWLPFLATCRQIYTEATCIFWKTCTFSFQGYGTLVRFSQHLCKQERDLVRRIHIDNYYPKKFLRTLLKKFTQLDSVHIDLVIAHDRGRVKSLLDKIYGEWKGNDDSQ